MDFSKDWTEENELACPRTKRKKGEHNGEGAEALWGSYHYVMHSEVFEKCLKVFGGLNAELY